MTQNQMDKKISNNIKNILPNNQFAMNQQVSILEFE